MLRKVVKWVLVSLLVFIFVNGCGGSSSSEKNSTVIDNSRLQFEPPFMVEVEENQKSAIQLKAVGCTDKPRYEISEDDFIFNCDPRTGVVNFKEFPNYKQQREYRFIAIATGCVDERVEEEIVIKIKEPKEGSDVSTETITQTETPTSVPTVTPTQTETPTPVPTVSPTSEIPNRFIRNDIKEVVQDNQKKIMWQDNIEVESIQKKWLNIENSETCPNKNKALCYNISGDTAIKYCLNLILNEFDDWRLPSIKELESIVDKTRSNKPYIQNSFKYITSSDQYYWSSTTYASFFGYAKEMNFNYYTSNHSLKITHGYVRCVRNMEKRFERDSLNEIVIDKNTNLMWQDNIDTKIIEKPWLTQANYQDCRNGNYARCLDTIGDTASTYCSELLLGSYNNWRLPTKDELFNIFDEEGIDIKIDKSFLNVPHQNQSTYWSSESVSSNLTDAWYAFFSTYASDNLRVYSKNVSMKIRCVRE